MDKELRARFNRVVQVKADMGFPFTIEDVADTMDVPCNELRASWLRPFVLRDDLRPIGKWRSRTPRSHRRMLTLWSGTYYLDLEEDEDALDDYALSEPPIAV